MISGTIQPSNKEKCILWTWSSIEEGAMLLDLLKKIGTGVEYHLDYLITKF